MLFATNQNSDSMLHIGDIVGDVLDVSRLGIVMGPGNRGIRVYWTTLDNPVANTDDVLDVDPLQLILVTKAAQC